MFDYHMHSCFSSDSDTPTKAMIEAAIKQGLSSICFTEHNDPDFPMGYATFDLDTKKYFETLFDYREQYKTQIDICIGVELGLQPHLAAHLQDYVKTYPFDFIIGSSHVVDKADPYYPEFFQGRKEYTSYCAYFQTIIDNLNVFSDIDVYGHLDYIVRYGPNKNKYFTYEKYADYLDVILKLMIEKNVGLEINTSGFKCGLDNPNPMPAIIKKYISLGGECFTFGSDAHTPEYVAYKYPKAISILKACGGKYICSFKNRTATYHKL